MVNSSEFKNVHLHFTNFPTKKKNKKTFPFQNKKLVNFTIAHFNSAHPHLDLGRLDTVPAAEIGVGGDPILKSVVNSIHPIAVQKKRLQPRNANEEKISLKGLQIE